MNSDLRAHPFVRLVTLRVQMDHDTTLEYSGAPGPDGFSQLLDGEHGRWTLDLRIDRARATSTDEIRHLREDLKRAQKDVGKLRRKLGEATQELERLRAAEGMAAARDAMLDGQVV